VESGGLTLLEPDAPPRSTSVTAVASLNRAFRDDAPFDLALLTVKAFDTAGVIAELQAATDAPPPILTLQNGVGNEEALAAAFGGGRVLSGAIDTPVSTPALGRVEVHRARYAIGLAAVGGASPVEETAAALAGAGFAVQRFPDYRGLKWTKLLMNILANAQCAILGWTPAQVMADPTAAALEARAWQEAIAVMRRLGISPVALGGYPLPLFAPLAERLPPRWLGRVLARFVSGGRGTKLPSLYLALETGRRSEVGWLNGAVVAHGGAVGVETPVNAVFTRTLEGLSAGTIPREAFRDAPERLARLTGLPSD
jgi:2-dehydropantoate 2-reductase